MRREFIIGCVLAALGWAGAVGAAAQYRPGEPTKALVWIENRSDAEAIPVSVRSAALASPIPVALAGTANVTLPPSTVIGARVIRQAWEYRQIVVATGRDAAEVLGPAGEEGWEVTGVHGAVPGGTAVLLKRPRT
jgi:hypothetical protein